MSKRPKNRSARDKQRARQRASQQARRQDYPLRRFQPPFEPYREWIRVPSAAGNMIAAPAGLDPRLTGDAKDLLDTLIKLGPRYHGIVPLAAVYLDRQLSRGSIFLARTGHPDQAREMPIAELAASAQEGVERDSAPITDDGASWHIHELHIHGYLIVDDDLIVNMAIPPTRPGGEWILNGHTTEWPGP